MNEAAVLNIGTEALRITMFLAGPMLIAAMVIGIIVSILQAITQINESTLTFIPKIIAVVVVLAFMAPWMLKVMQDYAVGVFSGVGDMIR